MIYFELFGPFSRRNKIEFQKNILNVFWKSNNKFKFPVRIWFQDIFDA